MKTACHEKFELKSFLNKKITGCFDGGAISADGGGLLLREIDLRYQITGQMASSLRDRRSARRIHHSLETLLRQRMYAIALGYEDANDHDRLRSDPVLKAACDNLPISGHDLASQPTLSRLENQVTARELIRLSHSLFELYLRAHPQKRGEVIIDLDSTDDPVHGMQQLSLFHGYYGQHMYHPLLVFDGITGFPMSVVLRPGNAHAAKGAVGILRRIIRKLKQAYPKATILVRGDGGFGVPAIYELCEAFGVHYLLGLGANNRLQAQTADLLDKALFAFNQSGVKQRFFTSFLYQADSWSKQRRVVAKVECMPEGTNRRFVVTNLPGKPQLLYDRIYCHRGEMENRIKELKNGLKADRLSCHRFLANQFRLLLHTFAYCLLWYLREHLANTPLGAAQAESLRLHMLKIGVRVVETTRRVWLHFASGYPWRELFLEVLRRIQSVSV